MEMEVERILDLREALLEAVGPTSTPMEPDPEKAKGLLEQAVGLSIEKINSLSDQQLVKIIGKHVMPLVAHALLVIFTSEAERAAGRLHRWR